MLVAGTGNVGKVKAVKFSLTGFAGAAGQTSNFGAGSDINSTDVEYLSLEMPTKKANDSTEIPTNARTIKDSVGDDAWDDYNGAEIFNDADLVNWKAFVAAQETNATGTMSFTVGTNVTNFKAKVSQAGGGAGGGATDFATSFTPTFTIIQSLPSSTTT